MGSRSKHRRGRRFGCEFELSTGFDDVAEICRPLIACVYGKNMLLVRRDVYRSVDNVQWHLKTDTTTQCELCTPVSTARCLPRICRVVDTLSKASVDKEGVKVTEDDSMHVHVAIGKVDPKNVLSLWLKHEKTILSMFPKHRRDNQYCESGVRGSTRGKVVANFFRDAVTNSREHHFAVSFPYMGDDDQSKRRRTVEFRVAEGNLDPETVRCWVGVCVALVEAAGRLNLAESLCEPESDGNLENLAKDLRLRNKGILGWMRARQKRFSPGLARRFP
jgi:hypothetical protein